MAKKDTEYYVNNKEFLEAIVVFRTKMLAAKEADTELPRIPRYIGDCFLKIITHAHR